MKRFVSILIIVVIFFAAAEILASHPRPFYLTYDACLIAKTKADLVEAGEYAVNEDYDGLTRMIKETRIGILRGGVKVRVIGRDVGHEVLIKIISHDIEVWTYDNMIYQDPTYLY